MASTKAEGDTSAAGQSPWTHNVMHGLAATFLYSIGGGLYQISVLPNFILLVGGSNAAVGLSASLQGVSMMVSAIPAGYLADKVSRKACVRIGVLLEFVANGCLITSVALAEPGSLHSYILLCVALSIQGICDGIMAGPLMTLMDDSCPAGKRSEVETANSIMSSIAQAAGPMIGGLVFMINGNSWSLSSMSIVIIAGTLINQLAIFPVWRMDDKFSLGQCSEAVQLQDELVEGSSELELRSKRSVCCGLVNTSRVRVVLFAGEVIMSLGAGMTVKFFPIFFDEDVHVNPARMQIVFASLFGFTALGTLMAQKAAKRFGRLQVIIPCFCVSVTCTALLGLLQPFYTLQYVMIPIFIFRCTSAWSVGALLGSIIADYTPKSTRGRWKAAGSIIASTWSGSAAVGGFLIDKYGFGPTFIITALFQTSVIPIWCLIVPLVAKESELLEASLGSGNLEAPLLLKSPVSPGSPTQFCSPGSPNHFN